MHKKLSKNKPRFDYKIIYIGLKLLILGVLLFFFSKHKPLLWILAFEILDLWKTILQRCMPQLPLNLDFIFGITASYFFSPLVGIIIYMLAIINRIVFFAITYRHFVKGIRYLFLFILVPYFRFIEFYYVALGFLIINYIIKYIGNLIFMPFELDDTFYDIANFILSCVVFYIISMLNFYLPILF